MFFPAHGWTIGDVQLVFCKFSRWKLFAQLSESFQSLDRKEKHFAFSRHKLPFKHSASELWSLLHKLRLGFSPFPSAMLLVLQNGMEFLGVKRASCFYKNIVWQNLAQLFPLASGRKIRDVWLRRDPAESRQKRLGAVQPFKQDQKRLHCVFRTVSFDKRVNIALVINEAHAFAVV